MFKRNIQNDKEEASFTSSRVQISKKRPSRGKGILQSKTVWRPNASINNLEQEKKKEVDREIRDKIKRRRHKLRLRLTLRTVVVVAACVLVYTLIGLASKRINLNLDNKVNDDYKSGLKSSISKDMGGTGILSYIRPPFIRYRAVERSLEKERDEIDSARLHFNLFKLRTEADLKTNIPLVKWIGSDGRPSYVDQKGRVFEPPTSFVEEFKPLEIGGTGLGAQPGSKVLASSDKLTWVVGLIPVLRSQGLSPIKVNIDAQSYKSIDVLLDGVEARLIFSIDEDFTRSGIAASRAVKYIEKEGGGEQALKNLTYIDIRTPERVLYR